MRTEGLDMRRDRASEALAQQADQRAVESVAETLERHGVPRNAALSGLAVAIPLSISLWTGIALIVWLLLR